MLFRSVFGQPVPEMGVLVVHDGDVQGAIQTDILCGAPNEKRGFVWDSWRLPQSEL